VGEQAVAGVNIGLLDNAKGKGLWCLKDYLPGISLSCFAGQDSEPHHRVPFAICATFRN